MTSHDKNRLSNRHHRKYRTEREGKRDRGSAAAGIEIVGQESSELLNPGVGRRYAWPNFPALIGGRRTNDEKEKQMAGAVARRGERRGPA
jgi:hypothetical protein